MREKFNPALLGVFAVFFIASSCVGIAKAGLPPTTLKGLDGSKKTTFNFQVPANQATQVSGTTSLIETGNPNVLVNPGGEGGTTGWTASGGSLTSETGAANVMPGAKKSLAWDSSAAAQTLSATSVSVTTGSGLNADLYGYCYVKCATGTCTHTLDLTDGTATTSQAIVSSTTGFVKTSVYHPGSGTMTLKLTSVNANEPQMFVGKCGLERADASRIQQLNQATLVGTLEYISTGGCTWSHTSGSNQPFSADTDCAAPTATGGLSATPTKIPGFVMTPSAGNYLVMVTGSFSLSTTTVTADAKFTISDGTYIQGSAQSAAGVGGGTNMHRESVMFGNFTYTSGQGPLTYEILAKTSSASNSVIIDGESVRSPGLVFTVYKYPSINDTVSTLDQLGTSWSGYHGSDCQWVRGSSGFANPTADATCTFTELHNSNFGSVSSYLSGSDKLPGIVFTPKKAGARYYVCAGTNVTGNVNNENVSFQLTDGTNVLAQSFVRLNLVGASSYLRPSLCGVYTAPSTSAATLRIELNPASGNAYIDANTITRTIDWTIFDLSSLGAVSFKGVPVSGEDLPRIESAYITVSASTPAITRQSGDWIASLTDNGAGDTTLNLTSGKFSSMTACQCSLLEGGSTEVCHFVADPTTSAVRVVTRDGSTGTANDNQNFYITCFGKR